jgi:hypothetical protein
MTTFFKAFSLLIILVPTGALLSRPSLASEYSEKFEKQLEKACAKSSPALIKTCPCYASNVTKRYNDVQLATIYSLLKFPDASKMFLVVHSPEAIACKGLIK